MINFYTLTLAPSLDYYMNVGDLRPDMVNRAESTRIEVGGKGINVSRVLRTLGVRNTAIIVTGGFTGKEIERRCKKAGLSIIPIESEAESRINVKLPGFEINAPAPEFKESEKLIALLDKTLSSGDVLIVSGTANMDVRKIGEIAASKKVSLIFDTAGKSLSQALECKPYLVKPNHIELCEFYGEEPTTDHAKLFWLAIRMTEQGAKNVAVSMGKAGAMIVSRWGELVSIEPHEITPVNTVGAGDSFLAGMVAGAFSANNLRCGLKLANACGAAAASSIGLPKRAAIEKILIGNRK
jgi:1-phosphofructokinase